MSVIRRTLKRIVLRVAIAYLRLPGGSWRNAGCCSGKLCVLRARLKSPMWTLTPYWLPLGLYKYCVNCTERTLTLYGKSREHGRVSTCMDQGICELDELGRCPVSRLR